MTIQKKKSGFKLIKWLAAGVVGLIVLTAGAVYCIYNYYDWQSLVRELVHKQGTAAVGTDVRIGKIELSLKDGNGSVKNITVANPKGYTKDHIIRLGGIAVSVDKDSIVKTIKETAQKTGSKTKTIVINEIVVDKPEVTYELMNLNKNNVSDILQNIKRNTASTPKQTTKQSTKSDIIYKVAIKKVVVANGKATVAANLLGTSESLSLNLPTININNLGTEKQSITIQEGLARIFQEILKTTANAVSKVDLKSIVGNVGDLANAATDTAEKAAQAAANTAGKAVDEVAGTAGKAANAAAEGVTKGVKGLSDSVGGLF